MTMHGHASTRILAASLLLVLCVAAASWADVVRLRDGTAIKGVPLPEKSDEGRLAIQDAVSGDLRRLAWTALDPEDARRLRIAWGYEAEPLEPIPAKRIRVVLDAGMTSSVRGVIQQQDKTHVQVMSFGQTHSIPWKRVHSMEDIQMHPLEVYTRGRWMERVIQAYPAALRGEDGALPTPVAMRFGRLAEEIGAFTYARELYAKVIADPESPHRAHAERRLAGLTDVEARVRAIRELRAIRGAVREKSFRNARHRLAMVRMEHPQAEGSLALQIARTARLLVQTREAWCVREVERALPAALERRIEAKAWARGVEFGEAVAWARRELIHEALDDTLRALLVRTDAGIDQVRAFWERRRRGAWRTVSYGSGSFIHVRTGAGPAPGGKRGGGPQPPTHDQWWDRAEAKERAAWLLAYVAENTDLFEVRTVDGGPCKPCEGRGRFTQRAPTGEDLEFLCSHCGGTGRERAVEFR